MMSRIVNNEIERLERPHGVLATWNVEGSCLPITKALASFGEKKMREVLVEKEAGMSGFITVLWANEHEDSASWNWMSHCPEQPPSLLLTKWTHQEY